MTDMNQLADFRFGFGTYYWKNYLLYFYPPSNIPIIGTRGKLSLYYEC